MKKKDLISKWLDYNLNDSEREAFNKLDESRSYHKISEAARLFKAPEFDRAGSYLILNKKLASRKTNRPLLKYMSGVAAILIVCFGIFYFLDTKSNQYLAANGATTELQLPDKSEVILNDGSQLSFNAKKWTENRAVSLNGEAYFKVTKGQKFTVRSSQGEVTVLGTQFNVKDRPGYFEVLCFEGSVLVSINGKKYVLSAGETVRSLGDSILNKTTESRRPEWLDKKSIFKSVPFQQVVQELERQYDIKVAGRAAEKKTLFTGSFSHENLETALQAITIPLNLSYSIDGKNVVLKNNRQ
jgi:ferric-dicitrate binding protein FerR (iron transport regulator)